MKAVQDRRDHGRGDSGPALFPRSKPPVPRDPRGGGPVVACLDDSAACDRILEQALAVAAGLELGVAAVRVIETPRHLGVPADPLEWQVRRRQSLERLNRALVASERGAVCIKRVLLAGPPADELTGWARENGVTLMVLGTHDQPNGEAGLGSTAQRVMERAGASLLLVPAGGGRLPYRRILVPLDGSSRAESVLPVAVRIARATGAELILAHVVPHSEAVGAGLQEASARALCLRLAEQNEHGARDYFDALQAQLWKERLPVRAIVAADGDPRTELRRLATEQRADLIVVASHGRSGMTDMPCGSVTEYLAAHAPAPLLVVRPDFGRVFAAASAPATSAISSPAPEHA